MAKDPASRNLALKAWMDEHEVSAGEFAEMLNEAMYAGGRQDGDVTRRTVFRWLSGERRSPQTAQLKALETVTGKTAAELGFVPRRVLVRPIPSLQDAPVQRRTFLAAASTTTLATLAATSSTGRPTVGLPDVTRLRGQLNELWLHDDQFGGGSSLEQRAIALAERTLGLQQNGAATQRVRARLYALAAAFTSAAMFAAFDARRLTEAQHHLEKAVTLAGLSGDAQVQHQLWRYASMLAVHKGRYTDAIAAAEACAQTKVHRADPFFASMTHSRIALAASNLGDGARALRALERSAEALERAETSIPRPASVNFYTLGELHGLAGIVHYRLGIAAESESHIHRCLAELRADQHRNRSYYRAQAALAQLAQGDVDQALATAQSVVPSPTDLTPGRVSHLLATFTSALTQNAASGTAVRDWRDFVRAL
ncbi:hypothetical protein GCM10029976_066570 [Kribbella albertanoniae]|uniref:Tat pathway signal protein n=1 Tax=Kribbella albertanoniae TaxID=1266829 RepID=A0A4R4QKB4_9ACTN|nr:Tat pathway signal protein [Kribbella albertanoniae]TDC35773.1 Tat pathway signal protein [Kribbella albertanoniae]